MLLEGVGGVARRSRDLVYLRGWGAVSVVYVVVWGNGEVLGGVGAEGSLGAAAEGVGGSAGGTAVARKGVTSVGAHFELLESVITDLLYCLTGS